MTNAIQIFENEEFGKIRTLTDDDKTLFCGKDVAEALGYAKPQNAIADHCPHALKRGVGVQTGTKADGTPAFQNVEMKFITEGDVYRLIAHSKLPSAEKFESWVFDEVLPSIRKHGGYIAGQENLTDDELLARAVLVAQSKIAERDKLIAQQKEQIKIMQPKADYADAVKETVNSIHVGDLAQLVCKRGVNIGRNRLFDWFLSKGILRKEGKEYKPYQKYMNLGVFEIKQGVVNIGKDKTITTHTIFVTGKGQTYLVDRIVKDFIKKDEKESEQ